MSEDSPKQDPEMNLEKFPSNSISSLKEHNPYDVTQSSPNPKRGFYPLSLLLCIFWMGYTLAVVLLLHEATRKQASHFSLDNDEIPWYYGELPGILLTIFSQAHLGITAAYLSRLAVSAVQHRRLSPSSWEELFWQADKKWSNPVGIASVLLKARRTGLSATFVLFAATSAIAIATPTVLTRAYPNVAFEVPVKVPTLLDVFSSDKINTFDVNTELSVAGGMWSSGLSPDQLFNTSIYLPPDRLEDEDVVDDFFFVGETFQMSARLLGVRMQGGCEIVDDDPSSLLNDTDFFSQYCPSDLFKYRSVAYKFKAGYPEATVNTTWCSTSSGIGSPIDGYYTSPDLATISSTAFLWIKAANSSETAISNTDTTAIGVIQCNATWSTGFADVDPEKTAFSNFKSSTVYNASNAQGGEPLTHPLNVALLDISSSSTMFKDVAVLRMLGYDTIMEEGNEKVLQPDLEAMKDNLWNGIGNAGATIGLLSVAEQQIDFTLQIPASGRKEVFHYALASWVLIGSWAALLLIQTALLYRPVTMSSLDSYAATHLLSKRPELLPVVREQSKMDNLGVMDVLMDLI